MFIAAASLYPNPMPDAPNPFDFSNRVALVTGSSRGIGAALVRGLNRHNARCIVNYVADPAGRNRADAEAVAGDLRDPGLVECDVSRPEQVAEMLARIQRDFGGLDILINNAGVIRDRSLKKISLDDWNTVLQVNLSGPFHCIRAAVDLIRTGGRIVNLASVSGTMGFFGQANYASSKAGVMALTKVAARELAKKQVTVNAIAPGFIDTEMTRGMPEDVTQSFIQQIPLSRMGTVDDIVGAALFLCSPFADYITGQTLHVNGGFFMG